MMGRAVAGSGAAPSHWPSPSAARRPRPKHRLRPPAASRARCPARRRRVRAGPAQMTPAAAATPAPAPPPPPGPMWPPPGTVVPASAVVPTRMVEIARVLPHGACREIAPIMGSGGGGIWTSSESKMQSAYGQLRSAAQAAGGDYALIDMVASDLRGITITAHAYDCSRTPPAQASSQPPAGAGASAEERLPAPRQAEAGRAHHARRVRRQAPRHSRRASDRVYGDGCLSPVLVRAHECSWCASFWWGWSRALAWRPVGEGASRALSRDPSRTTRTCSRW